MVGKRIVCVTKISGGPLWVSMNDRHGQQYMRDIDRALHILSGLPAPEAMQGIVQAMHDAIGRKEWSAESDLVRVVWFKNGNGHLSIKSAKLRDDVNREIGLYYGAALGACREHAA